MVYYHIELDEIFLSGELDAYFFGLVAGVDWYKVEILGEL